MAARQEAELVATPPAPPSLNWVPRPLSRVPETSPCRPCGNATSRSGSSCCKDAIRVRPARSDGCQAVIPTQTIR